MDAGDLRGRAADIAARVHAVAAMKAYGRGADPLGLAPSRAVHGTEKNAALAELATLVDLTWSDAGEEAAIVAVRAAASVLAIYDVEGLAVVLHALAPQAKIAIWPHVYAWWWAAEARATWDLVEELLEREEQR